MPLTARLPSGMKAPFNRPLKPPLTPKTSSPLSRPARTTVRMAAFIPGASPPLVNTAILFMGRVYKRKFETEPYFSPYY